MALNEGEIVKVDYTAMDEKGGVFDTTTEKKAIDAGIYNEKQVYKPAIAVIGERNFFGKVDEAVKNAELGKKIELELEPKDAFGERNADFIKMVPLREFKAQKLVPFPGMPVEINNMQGRVQTVSGGRVRVDFNHPLAGKKVKYELEVKEVITEKNAKIQALFEKFFQFSKKQADFSHELKQDALEVAVPEKLAQGLVPLKKAFADTALKYVAGLKKVRFVEEYVKAEKKEESLKEAGKEGKAEGKEKPPEEKAEKEEKTEEKPAEGKAEKEEKPAEGEKKKETWKEAEKKSEKAKEAPKSG